MGIQNVNFRSTEDFFEFIPENELKIVVQLRQLIFDCIPEVKEKLAYNVPFYKKHSNICFIWPSSISWGNVKHPGAVRLGFTRGNLLNNQEDYLEKGNRKNVYCKDFSDTTEINFELLKSYLYEAAEVDAQIAKAKKK